MEINQEELDRLSISDLKSLADTYFEAAKKDGAYLLNTLKILDALSIEMDKRINKIFIY